MNEQSHTATSAPTDLALDLESIIATAAEYLGKVPSFGDGIGNEVSKPQLGLAYHELIRARDLVQQLRTQRAALAGAIIRMMVGVTRESLPTCDYYEGIEHDACDEARAALASLEGGQDA